MAQADVKEADQYFEERTKNKQDLRNRRQVVSDELAALAQKEAELKARLESLAREDADLDTDFAVSLTSVLFVSPTLTHSIAFFEHWVQRAGAAVSTRTQPRCSSHCRAITLQWSRHRCYLRK
jgi:hypothetical protein